LSDDDSQQISTHEKGEEKFIFEERKTLLNFPVGECLLLNLICVISVCVRIAWGLEKVKKREKDGSWR
jgi:hypothetical protein